MTKLYIFFLIIFLLSCNTKHSANDKDFIRESVEQFKTVNEIAQKYNANSKLDTLYFPTTYQFQEYITKNNIYVIHSFNPVDVVQLDSIFMIKIDIGVDISFLPVWLNHELTLTCKENQLKDIFDGYPDITSKEDVLNKNDVSLIVKLDSVQKQNMSSFLFTGELLEVVK